MTEIFWGKIYWICSLSFSFGPSWTWIEEEKFIQPTTRGLTRHFGFTFGRLLCCPSFCTVWFTSKHIANNKCFNFHCYWFELELLPLLYLPPKHNTKWGKKKTDILSSSLTNSSWVCQLLLQLCTVTVHFFKGFFFLYEYNKHFWLLLSEGTQLTVRICFFNLISEHTLCHVWNNFYMHWFVMPIIGCSVPFYFHFSLTLSVWFLPCDLCNTCSGVPSLKLKDDVDLTCKYCIKKCGKHAELCETTNRTEWKSS